MADQGFRFTNIWDGYGDDGYQIDDKSLFSDWTTFVVLGGIISAPGLVWLIWFLHDKAAVAWVHDVASAIMPDISVGDSEGLMWLFMVCFAVFLHVSIYPAVRKVKHALMERHKWLALPGWVACYPYARHDHFWDLTRLLVGIRITVAGAIRLLLASIPYLAVSALAS